MIGGAWVVGQPAIAGSAKNTRSNGDDHAGFLERVCTEVGDVTQVRITMLAIL